MCAIEGGEVTFRLEACVGEIRGLCARFSDFELGFLNFVRTSEAVTYGAFEPESPFSCLSSFLHSNPSPFP